MSMIKEPLNGGVVTARDPSTLFEGELQQADDFILKPYTPAVHRVPGRTAFGTVDAGDPVRGLAHLAFDEASDQLVAWAATSLLAAPFTGLTGTFASIATGLTDDTTGQMDTVHYGSAHFLLLGGLNRPKRVAYVSQPNAVPTLGTRTMGMDPVGQVASLSSTSFGVATTSGTWPVASLGFGPGTYWFLITEVYHPGESDEIESSFIPYNEDQSTNLKAVAITDVTTQAIIVTRHSPLVNDGSQGRNTATHWQVYIAGPVEDTADVNRPSITQFKRLGDPISISATTFTFTSNSVTRGATTSGTTGFPASTAAFGAHTQFDSPNNMIGRANGTMAEGNSNDDANVLRGYALTGSGSTVTGIEVTLIGLWISDGNSSPAGAIIGLSNNNGTSVKGGDTNKREFRFEPSNTVLRAANFYVGSIRRGGNGDLWGTTWGTGDLVDATFAVIMQKIGTLHNDRLLVDTVSVKIYLDGGGVVTKEAFRSVVIETEVGVTAAFGADMPPPKASTGDMFEGQLVLNNVEKPHQMHYSVPDRPESFPQPYVVGFQSKKHDRITAIRRVGAILVVGMETSIKRMNYLPREDDAQFDRGRAFEDITVRSGIPGPQACVVVDMGFGPVLAYVSQTGLRMTDGVTDRSLNEDLAWTTLVEQSLLHQAILRDDVQNQALVLYYTPDGGSANTKAIQFSYHEMHRKSGGKLPAMGPLTVSVRSAAMADLGTVPVLLTGHPTDGVVYVENQGTSDASGGTITPVLRTRLQYLGDVGSKTRIKRVYSRVSANGAQITAASTTTISSTTVTSAALFGNVTVGMYVTGTGIQPGTKVSAKASSSSITISQAATASGSVTLTFSSGAIELTIRKQNIGETATDLQTIIEDTFVGGLLRTHLDNQAEAHELKIAKVPTVNADLAVHYVGFETVTHGKENSTR